MYSLLRFLIMVLVSVAVWMAIGLGVGFVLHWVVPAIDLGMATLIGVVTLGGCFLWLSRISTLEASTGTTTSKCRTPHGQRRPGLKRDQRVENGEIVRRNSRPDD
jgi:hypothetical protein